MIHQEAAQGKGSTARMVTFRGKCQARDCDEGCCYCGAPITIYAAGHDEVSMKIEMVSVCKHGHASTSDDIESLEMRVNEGFFPEGAA